MICLADKMKRPVRADTLMLTGAWSRITGGTGVAGALRAAGGGLKRRARVQVMRFSWSPMRVWWRTAATRKVWRAAS
jgi:hypothetical protein